MSLDEQLPDLLAQEAEHADAAPPTMDGVHAVVARRARRRKRQHRVGTGLAALCVVAGIAGGLALARDDAGPTTADQTVELPEVPLVGVDLPGWMLGRSFRNTSEIAADQRFTPIVVFRDSAAGLAGPMITVTTDLPVANTARHGEPIPIDLDGTEGSRQRTVAGFAEITWRDANGQTVHVAGLGVSDADLAAYATGLAGQSLDLADLPPPNGLSERTAHLGGSAIESTWAHTTYGDEIGAIEVDVWNAPEYYDVVAANTAAEFGLGREVPVGQNPLGHGTALLFLDRSDGGSDQTVLWRTDAGLVVRLHAYFDAEPRLVELMAEGRLAVLDDDVTLAPSDDLVAIPEAGCPAEPGSPTSLAEEPRSYFRYGQYDRWRDPDGCPVRIDVISSTHLAEHCGWEAARSITIGRPLGAPIGRQFSPTTAIRYLWNADGVLITLPPGDTIPADDLPETATDTGYRLGSQEMWFDPADENSLYVVDGDEALVFVDAGLDGVCA